MKNIILILIGVVVIAAGVYFLTNKNNESDTVTNTEETTVESEYPAMMEGDVTEMEVVEDNGVMEAMESDDTEETEGTEKTFDIDSFKFGYSMETITVNEGDTVTINLTSSDGLHDWVVDEFAAATDMISDGGNTSVTFVADKAGTYEFYCSVGNHREMGMVGTLVVE